MRQLWKRIARRRVAAALAAGLVALTLALVFLPGAGLRWGVVNALQSLGMVEISVSDADLGLFGGRVLLRQVQARPKVGKSLGLGDLDLVFNWRPLLSRRVSLPSLSLDGLSLEIHREGGLLVINGLSMPAGGGGDDASAWSFDVDSFRLTASRVEFSDGPLKLDLAVDLFEIGDLRSWDGARPARLRFEGRLDGRPLKVSGTLTPFATAPGFDLVIETDRLDLARLAPLAGGLRRLGGELGGTLKLAGTLAAEPRIEAEGQLKLADPVLAVDGFEVGAQGASLDLGHFGWDGDRAEFKGSFAVTRLAAKTATARAELEGLSASAESLVYQARHQDLDWRGSLAFAGGQVSVPGLTAQPVKLAWSGRTILKDGKTLHLDGHLDDAGAKVMAAGFQYEHRQATAAGTVDLILAATGDPVVSASLTLGADALVVRDGLGNRDFAALDRLDVADLRLIPDPKGGTPRVSLGRLDARNLAALQQRGRGAYPWRVEARTARVDRAAFDAVGGATVEAAALDGVTLRLTRTKDGIVGLSPGAKSDGAAQPSPRLALGKLSVVGKSRVIFEDRSLAQPVRLSAEGVQLAFADLDSARPDRDSPFDFKARLGQASVNASGAARPFATKLSARLNGRIKAFELPPLSPYALDALGVELETGHFDGEVKAAVDRGALDGRVDLVLSNLFVAQPGPESRIAKRADMPIATVLDLLRDGDDRITLTVPFGGDLGDPQFDVSDAVSQAIGGALRSTALTTLKIVFPVAALIELATSDDSGGLALEPVAFAAGDESLDEAQRPRLDKVAQLLRQRPGLKLSLCPVAATRLDWPVLLERKKRDELGIFYKIQKLVNAEAKPEAVPPDADSLAALAGRRAEAVKAALADGAGIDLGRLFSCRPEVDDGAKAVPVVKLML